MFVKKFVLSALGMSLLLAGAAISAAQISVTVKASPATVDANDASALSAVVANDASGAGVTWAVSGGGTLSGQTKTAATYTAPLPAAAVVTATVTATSVTDKTKTGTVKITVPAAPKITTATLAAGKVGTAYSATLAGSGGIPPYTWTMTAGTLPAGLKLSTAGAITGTPTAAGAGTAAVTFKLTDSGKATPLTASARLSIIVSAAPAIAFTSSASLSALYKTLLSTNITATGGAGTLTYTITQGTLPTGLALSTTGLLSGTPTVTGSFSFTVKAADAFGDFASKAFSLTVSYPALKVTTTTPPRGYVGSTYAATLAASGGSGTGYTWSLATGSSLPAGLTLSAAGMLGGKPTTAGTSSTTVTVKDSVSHTATGILTFAIIPALSLPSPNPSTLPSTRVGQSYNGTITASGGLGPTFNWWVNGLGISSPGQHVTLSNGLNATTTNNNVLVIQGTPTSAGSVTFTVQVQDSASHLAGPVTYTISIASAGYQVSGQIWLDNVCGGNVSVPPIKVSINTNPVQTATTDGSGHYSFATVPNGTYTITPSITGPSSLFTPASIGNVVVNNGAVSNKNFSVWLGYSISGTVSYSGSRTGPIYVSLNNQNCGNNSMGVSIPAPGAFTIRGVPPGAYYLAAWRDILGFGQPNLSDPGGFINNLSVPAGGLTSKNVSISDPPAYSITSGPQLGSINPMNAGVVINYGAITGKNPNNVTVELPTSYLVQWSTTPNFGSVLSHSFAASGANGAEVWFLYNGMAGLTSSFANGASYYFRAAGVVGGVQGPWTVFGGGTPTAVKIGAPTGGNAVSGAVTFPGTARGPLAVGFFDENTGRAYMAWINNPVSPQGYTVHVPTGSGYYFFAILDQNKDGMIGSGDFSSTNDSGNSVSISGAITNQNLTMTAANSTARVQTQRWRRQDQAVTNTGFGIDLTVGGGNKLPVAVTLTGGPHMLAPIDMARCTDCRSSTFNVGFQVNATPVVGDTYTFNVAYSDGSSEAVTGKVTGVLPSSALPTLDSPTGSGNSSTPSFHWTYPANSGSYTYDFWLCCGNNGTIWQIPGRNSDARGFTASQIAPPLAWGVDPTDSGNKPSLSTLASGGEYAWSIEALDSNGNSAQGQMNFFTQALPLKLPSPNPASLPSGVVNAPYNGTISATGGVQPYTWTVSGFPDDGLNWTWGNSCGCVTIAGTPGSITTAGHPISFQVSVRDNTGATYGPVTYTIVVNSVAPVSLPAANSNPLGTALEGILYSSTINASGGAGGGHYSFLVNGVAIPTNSTYTTVANGWLQAKNSGGNSLFLSGTPSSAGTISLTVKVINTTNTNDTATVTYALPVTAGPSGANNSHLNGRYVCRIQGFNDGDGSRWASLASMVMNGSGAVTSGVWDTSGRDIPSGMSGTLTGTFSIGADNNGLARISAIQTSGGAGTHQSGYAIALTSATTPAQHFRMVQADDVGSSPSGQTSTADCYLASTSAFTSSTINGHSFAFGIQGENGNGTPKAYVGRMSAAIGSISNGYMDGMRVDQSGDNGGSFTGTYTTPNTTTGRFTLLVNAASTVTFAVYIIDANRMFMLQTAGDTGLMAGEMRTQLNTSTYSASGLKGAMVLYGQAFNYSISNNSVSGYDSMIFRVSGTGNGSLKVDASYGNEDGAYTPNVANGESVPVTFDTSYPGRATFSTPDSNYIYFFNTNTAFYLELSGSEHLLQTGWMENQAQTTFTNAAIAANYMMGQMPLLTGSQNGNVGEFSLDSSGGISGAISTAGEGYFTYASPLSMSYAWDTTTLGVGAFLINNPGKSGASCAVITASKFVCLLQSDDPSVMVLEK